MTDTNRVSAVYVGNQLVAPGDCPICGWRLADLKCQRPSCGKQFSSLKDLNAAYELAEWVSQNTNMEHKL